MTQEYLEAGSTLDHCTKNMVILHSAERNLDDECLVAPYTSVKK